MAGSFGLSKIKLKGSEKMKSKVKKKKWQMPKLKELKIKTQVYAQPWICVKVFSGDVASCCSFTAPPAQS